MSNSSETSRIPDLEAAEWRPTPSRSPAPALSELPRRGSRAGRAPRRTGRGEREGRLHWEGRDQQVFARPLPPLQGQGCELQIAH